MDATEEKIFKKLCDSEKNVHLFNRQGWKRHVALSRLATLCQIGSSLRPLTNAIQPFGGHAQAGFFPNTPSTVLLIRRPKN